MVEGNKHDIAIIQDHLFERRKKEPRTRERIKIKYSFMQEGEKYYNPFDVCAVLKS